MTETTAEFPKMLYKGGAPYDEETGRGVAHQFTLVVHDAEEEAAAVADGFAPAAVFPDPAPEAPEAGDETADAPAAESTVAAAAGDDSVAGAAGADLMASDAGNDLIG